MHDSADAIIKFRQLLDGFYAEIKKVMVAQDQVIREVLICLVAGGNVLLEGVPGLGKTLLVKSIAQCLDAGFSRIQFTPDLMPADIIGTTVIMEDASGRKSFEFQKGPIFSNIILTDEINRATPKTQSALLEAMQEKSVTVSGTTHTLEEPFFVLATQNSIEMEGTYPLPEAQLDRFFFKCIVQTANATEMTEILKRTTTDTVTKVNKVISGQDLLEMRKCALQIQISEEMLQYVSHLVLSTHPANKNSFKNINAYVKYGSSVRGAQAIVSAAKIKALWNGRAHVVLDDVAEIAICALRHRIILNFEGQAENIKTEDLIAEIIEQTDHIPEHVRSLLKDSK